MANFFGIDYASGSEVQDEMTGTFETLKAQAAGDPLKLAAISQQQAMFNLLGSPGLRQAKQRDKVVSDVLSNTQQNPDEDELDYQMRVAKQLRTAAAKTEPTLSLAANERILKLQTAQKERDKLKWQETIDKDDYDKSRTLLITLNRPDGTSVPVKRFPPDTSIDVINAEREKLQKAMGAGSENVYDITSWEGAFKNDLPYKPYASGLGKGIPGQGGVLGDMNTTKSNLDKWRTQVTAATSFVEGVDQVINKVIEDPYVGLKLGEAEISLASTLKSASVGIAKYLVSQGKEADPEKIAAEEAYTIEGNINRFAKLINGVAPDLMGNGERADIFRAQMTSIAYQLAKTLDPSGRLSNQDVEMAIKMLTGQVGSAEEIMQLMDERMNLNESGLTAVLKHADNGLLEVVEGDSTYREEARRYRGTRKALAEKMFAFSKIRSKDQEALNSLGRLPQGLNTQAAPAGSGKIKFTVRPAVQ